MDVNSSVDPASVLAGLTRSQFYISLTEVVLTASYANILNINFTGGMICFLLRTDNSAVSVKIIVDSVTVFESSLADLAALKSGDVSGGLSTLSLFDGDKALVLDFRRSRVTTNVTIQAKENGKKIKGSYFHYEVA